MNVLRRNSENPASPSLVNPLRSPSAISVPFVCSFCALYPTSVNAKHEVVIPGREGRERTRNLEIPGLRRKCSASRNDKGEGYFQSMILLLSPSNSMLQNAPPW